MSNIRQLYFSVFTIITLAVAFVNAQGLEYEHPIIPGFEPPFVSQNVSPLTNPEAAMGLLKNTSTMFRDTAMIDFEGRALTFARTDAEGNVIWTYHYDEFSDFVSASRTRSFHEAWYAALNDDARRRAPPPPPPRLQWELAVNYPPWARRLLGDQPPRLTIEGRLQLTAAYEQTTIRVDGTPPVVNRNPLNIETDYEFTISGTVGRLISVNISASKQDGFDLSEDPLRNFKVEYKESEPGELEDEIIQEIVIGYTGFDMPGTNLSGYSDRHEGLFGARMRAKFGPLMLTGIVSHAQGEALSVELGGRNDPNASAPLRETEFIRNRYFFLDSTYRADYNAGRRPQARVVDFQAFLSLDNCHETANTTNRRFEARDLPGTCFRMLEENRDYIIDRDIGVIRFEQNVRNEDIVAITMTTVGGSRNVGTLVRIDAADNSVQDLWILKPSDMENFNPATSNDTLMANRFGLMWRNVYHLSGVDANLFDIFYLDPAVGDTIRHITQGGRTVPLSHVLGLTDEQGRPRVDNVEIFNLANQELIFPIWNAGINGNEPFANEALGDYALTSDSSIYRMGQRTPFMQTNYVPKFGIVTGASNRRTSYDNLGWNIIPGTVSVRTNGGTTLVEGEDFELDYQMGIIELTSQRARAAESIIVQYQRESDFVLDRKLFAGLRGEMALPFISPNSFMAASLLYQNAATTAEDIPQLGNEPFSKLHLSFNTSLDFQPEWMTRAVDWLPRVTAEEPSAAKIDFEIVRSSMNSNTSSDGSAYIEDFERTKDAHSVSMRHTLWHPSHFPFAYERPSGGAATSWSEAISAAMLQTGRVPAWQFYWFTPNAHDTENRINEFSVWLRDEHSRRQTSNDFFIDALRLRATPASREHPEFVRDRFSNAYASVTASLGRNGINMENHRYIEMVLNPVGPRNNIPNRRRGKLMVQIGTFSHDQVRDGGAPNGRFDLEDTTYQNSPALLSQFDLGLNRLRPEDKFYLIPNAANNGWDTISANSEHANLLVAPRSRDNPSGDRFERYDRDNLGNFRHVNGTWSNSLYDSENIDNDGVPRINISEQYFSYIIDLDAIAPLNNNVAYDDKHARVIRDDGWRFLRIPLQEDLEGAGVTKDTVNGGADWSRVRGVRLVWFDFDENAMTTENELVIASIELVGNHWEPMAGSERKVEPTSISNYEDDNYANSVFRTIVQPKAGERTPEEKSLRLNFDFDRFDDDDTVLVHRNMIGNPQNLSGYDSITVMVNDWDIPPDALHFVMRFGSNDSTYYEMTAPLRGVQEWNRFAVSLQDLSDLKREALEGVADTSSAVGDTTLPNGITIRMQAPRGRRPNFTAITYMAFGVAGKTSGTGEIWVNELIATGARRLTGVAGRFDIATQWSDFLSLNLRTGYTGGNFRTMTDATFGTDNRSEVFANFDAKMQLDKFLPEEWGVSLPVGGSVSGSLTRPTTQPQSDVLLLNDNGNPDGFLDMAGDAMNLMFGRGRETNDDEASRGQLFETYSATRTLYASFERTGRSENPLINFTLDRIKTDVSYNQTASYTARGSLADESLRTDTTETYAGNLRYDLSPRNPPSWTTFTPFENSEWMPQLYRGYKFNLLPSAITIDLAEFTHRVERRNDVRLGVDNFETRTFDMRHGLQISYTPIDPLLAFSYNTRVERDLSDVETGGWDVMRDEMFPGIFSLNNEDGEFWDLYGVMHGERRRTQTASMRLSPQFVTWLTHTADYSASYTGSMTTRDNDPRQYLNAGVGTTMRIRNALAVADLLKKWTVTPPAATAADTTDTTSAPAPNLSPLTRFSNAVNKLSIRTINFDYEVATDLRNSFLTSSFLADTMGLSNFDFFMYQVGLRRSPQDHFTGHLGDDGLGWMRYREMLGVDPELYRFDQTRGSWSARFSSALTIPEPVRINITAVSFGWGREFFSQPDTTFIDTTVVLPEIRMSANTDALMRIGLVKRHMTRLTANTSATYRVSRKETRDRTDTTTALEFQPLISLDGRFVRLPALTSSYRYSRSNTEVVAGAKVPADSVDSAGDPVLPPDGPISTENTTRSGHTLTLGYEFSNTIRLQEIRIRNFVIPIQGKMTVGVTFNRDRQERRVFRLGMEEGDEEVELNTEFNYSPFIEYLFTENVRGEARHLGSHRNRNGRKETQHRFALSVEIIF